MPNKRIDFKTALKKTKEAFEKSEKRVSENPLMDEIFKNDTSLNETK